MRHLTPACAILAAAIVIAVPRAHAGTLDLNINLASVHTERWARDSLNQRNPGIGVTYQWSRTWSIAGGVYSNSYRRPTVYALAEFTPLHAGQANHWHLDAGLAAGFASGYRRSEIPCEPFVGAALIRVTAPNGIASSIVGVPNMGAYNSGFLGFQVSVPLRHAESD